MCFCCVLACSQGDLLSLWCVCLPCLRTHKAFTSFSVTVMYVTSMYLFIYITPSRAATATAAQKVAAIAATEEQKILLLLLVEVALESSLLLLTAKIQAGLFEPLQLTFGSNLWADVEV